ncbi:MAG: DUF1566 domain-containing protein [Candidatus Scalindua sp.]|nr:DUF1566 domain-containing protein [Candidatus Scalindua sp.]
MLILAAVVVLSSVSSFLEKTYAEEADEKKTCQLGEPAKEKVPFSKGDEPHMIPVYLRSSHKALNNTEVKTMLKEYNFFSTDSNIDGNFDNDYAGKRVHGVNVVIDRATGLMWDKSGSARFMSWKDAREWINDLNHSMYGGYSDWRLPTAEEAASLLESGKKYGGLYIDPIFDRRQPYIWTADTREGSGGGIALSVYFDDAKIRWDETNSINRNFVRPVRTDR